jgi:hypothetical protein
LTTTTKLDPKKVASYSKPTESVMKLALAKDSPWTWFEGTGLIL